MAREDGDHRFRRGDLRVIQVVGPFGECEVLDQVILDRILEKDSRPTIMACLSSHSRPFKCKQWSHRNSLLAHSISSRSISNAIRDCRDMMKWGPFRPMIADA